MERSAAGRGSRGVWAFGVALGAAGSLLDFYSAYLLLAHSTMVSGGMAAVDQGDVWGAGIAMLGVVLLVTALAAAASSGSRMMDYGALMAVYGAVMLFVGGFMVLGLVGQMVVATSVPGLGMLGIGALMLVNGALMRRAM